MMPNNYYEVLAIVRLYERKIYEINYKIYYNRFNLGYQTTAEYSEQRAQLKKKIIILLTLYIDKISENYLAEKLHGKAFRELLLEYFDGTITKNSMPGPGQHTQLCSSTPLFQQFTQNFISKTWMQKP
ncbi:MAG TPA: hypothetical protein VGB44_07125 [Flavobacterium sp.]|jgi:hypothetical protein